MTAYCLRPWCLCGSGSRKGKACQLLNGQVHKVTGGEIIEVCSLFQSSPLTGMFQLQVANQAACEKDHVRIANMLSSHVRAVLQGFQ